jgi:hypothetical protein
MVCIALLGAVIAGQCFQHCAWCREIDLKSKWNDKIALENPHKGWYHHYFDNHIERYLPAKDSDLIDFPGMDHLYLRLSWAYLEPKEGQFNWAVIDKVIDKWTAKGFKIAFRISCRETGTDRIEQRYATPKWVIEAGAKGGHWYKGKQTGSDGPWESAYDDPVYIEKLDKFLRAFAARYDGKPWLRYVDIGSIGDWGEGHTSSGSRTRYGYEQRKVHVDLHCKYFTKTQLVVTDDFVYTIEDLADRERMHRYVLSKGITYRDDSILVNYYIGAYPDTFTVRSPQWFADVWRDKPTVLELEHYRSVRRLGNWKGTPSSSLAKHGLGGGQAIMRGAMELLHATYIGFHGYADVWLAENPEFTVDLLNRCGYWFFLHTVDIPDKMRPGESYEMKLTWENKGVAPAYQPYILKVQLAGKQTAEFEFESGNQRWVPDWPGKRYRTSYKLDVPSDLPPGAYTLRIKLYAEDEKRDVFLALDSDLLDAQNFYRVASVNISAEQR